MSAWVAGSYICFEFSRSRHRATELAAERPRSPARANGPLQGTTLKRASA